ncbi:MAG: O-antigen ligase family protein [Anaerolineae bacterium]|nr:O-antigen ligase family protein [Anaerolineae bacterium]
MLLTMTQGVQSLIGRLKYFFLDRYYTRTMHITLVIACLLLSLVAAAITAKSLLMGLMIVAGMVGLSTLLFLYRQMEFGILSLVVVSTIFNFGVGTGTGTDITLTLMLLLVLSFLWLVRIFIVDRSFKSIRPMAINWPAMLFIVAVIISTVWSVLYVEPHVRYLMMDKWKPRLMTMLVLIVSPMATLLFANFVRSMRGMKFFVWYFIIIGAISAIPMLLNDQVPFAPLWNVRGQFPTWVAALAMGQLLFNKQLDLKWKAVSLFAAGAWAYIQIGLGISWLSGWVPVCLVIGVVLILYSRHMIIVLAIAASLFLVIKWDSVQEILDSESAESGSTRVEAWDHTLQIAGGHFLFGTGPAGYYFYLTTDIGGLFQLSHNNYLDIISQTGLFGFVAYMSFWFAVGWILWKTWRIIPRNGFEYGVFTALVASWLATLAAMMLGDWVTPFTYTQTLAGISYTIWPWLLAGLGIALYFYTKNQQLVEAEI